MKENRIIAVQGNLYCYDKFDEDIQMHKVADIEIDEEGRLTCTYRSWYFTDEDLQDNKIDLTQKQWCGLVEQIIQDEYPELDDDSISAAATDIVCRCFVSGMPIVEELPEYIAEYLNR